MVDTMVDDMVDAMIAHHIHRIRTVVSDVREAHRHTCTARTTGAKQGVITQTSARMVRGAAPGSADRILSGMPQGTVPGGETSSGKRLIPVRQRQNNSRMYNPSTKHKITKKKHRHTFYDDDVRQTKASFPCTPRRDTKTLCPRCMRLAVQQHTYLVY